MRRPSRSERLAAKGGAARRRPKRRAAAKTHYFKYQLANNPSRVEETDLKRALEESLKEQANLLANNKTTTPIASSNNVINLRRNQNNRKNNNNNSNNTTTTTKNNKDTTVKQPNISTTTTTTNYINTKNQIKTSNKNASCNITNGSESSGKSSISSSSSSSSNNTSSSSNHNDISIVSIIPPSAKKNNNNNNIKRISQSNATSGSPLKRTRSATLLKDFQSISKNKKNNISVSEMNVSNNGKRSRTNVTPSVYTNNQDKIHHPKQQQQQAKSPITNGLQTTNCDAITNINRPTQTNSTNINRTTIKPTTSSSTNTIITYNTNHDHNNTGIHNNSNSCDSIGNNDKINTGRQKTLRTYSRVKSSNCKLADHINTSNANDNVINKEHNSKQTQANIQGPNCSTPIYKQQTSKYSSNKTQTTNAHHDNLQRDHVSNINDSKSSSAPETMDKGEQWPQASSRSTQTNMKKKKKMKMKKNKRLGLKGRVDSNPVVADTLKTSNKGQGKIDNSRVNIPTNREELIGNGLDVVTTNDHQTNEAQYLSQIAPISELAPDGSSCVVKYTAKKRSNQGSWSLMGIPEENIIYLHDEEPPRRLICYPAIKHVEGDVIRVRDSVLLRSGAKKTDLSYIAKVCNFWEDAESGNVLMSLYWYYRPEHTEDGRKKHHLPDEIFASSHRDVDSVECIDDKCYVLTFNEYCRFKKRCKMEQYNVPWSLTDVTIPQCNEPYHRRSRLPDINVNQELVFCCRQIYDSRLKRLMRNPLISPKYGHI